MAARTGGLCHIQEQGQLYSLSLTLALADPASGTTPLSHQQTTVSLLKADLRLLVSAIPRILVALAFQARQTANWAELRETILYVTVSVMELQLLISLSVLWLVVPGVTVLPWLALQVASLWIILQYMNGRTRPFLITPERMTTKTLDDKTEQLDWFVVGGLVNNARMRRTVLPRLTTIFGNRMHTFPSHRLGFALDIGLVLLQRNLHVPTARSVRLYNSVRASLLKPETNGVRIIAHNTGALDVSWLLARLCADLPAGSQLGKLQIFTFGAASVEMVMPLGSGRLQSENKCKMSYPDVTNFAFADDPMAQIGVLLGMRQRLQGRFVGSLYTIHTAAPAFTWRSHNSFEDYLDALLPNGNPRTGVLGQECKVDSELSEMRELAALVQSITNEHLRMRDVKRRSWTPIGAVENKGKESDITSPLSLADTRNRTERVNGRKGYEENLLVQAIK